MSEELQDLKDRADLLGITYKANIGVESLRTKISAVLNDQATAQQVNALDAAPVADTSALAALGLSPQVIALLEMLAGGKALQPGMVPTPAEPVMSRVEVDQVERDKQMSEQMKLVRIRIACLNPQKAHVQGEIITVGNRFVGTVRKYVPFGEMTDNGYHVPYIIYTQLKSRQFNQVTTKKGPNGRVLPIQRLVHEFAIEVLDPLTPAELDALARQQAAAAGM